MKKSKKNQITSKKNQKTYTLINQKNQKKIKKNKKLNKTHTLIGCRFFASSFLSYSNLIIIIKERVVRTTFR